MFLPIDFGNIILLMILAWAKRVPTKDNCFLIAQLTSHHSNINTLSFQNRTCLPNMFVCPKHAVWDSLANVLR